MCPLILDYCDVSLMDLTIFGSQPRVCSNSLAAFVIWLAIALPPLIHMWRKRKTKGFQFNLKTVLIASAILPFLVWSLTSNVYCVFFFKGHSPEWLGVIYAAVFACAVSAVFTWGLTRPVSENDVSSSPSHSESP